jgi:hypothetical protein
MALLAFIWGAEIVRGNVPTFKAEGKVVNQKGESMPNMIVSLFRNGAANPSGTAISDKNGEFSIDFSPAETIVLCAVDTNWQSLPDEISGKIKPPYQTIQVHFDPEGSYNKAHSAALLAGLKIFINDPITYESQLQEFDRLRPIRVDVDLRTSLDKLLNKIDSQGRPN